MRPIYDQIRTTMTETPDERCPCCNKMPTNNLYGLNEDTSKFAIHGFGISLYFAMSRYIIYICLILLLGCAGIGFMYYNGGVNELTFNDPNTLIKDEERIASIDYRDSFLNQLSIGRAKYEEVSNVLLIAISGIMILFYFSWVQFNTILYSLDVTLNIDNLTPDRKSVV